MAATEQLGDERWASQPLGPIPRAELLRNSSPVLSLRRRWRSLTDPHESRWWTLLWLVIGLLGTYWCAFMPGSIVGLFLGMTLSRVYVLVTGVVFALWLLLAQRAGKHAAFFFPALGFAVIPVTLIGLFNVVALSFAMTSGQLDWHIVPWIPMYLSSIALALVFVINATRAIKVASECSPVRDQWAHLILGLVVPPLFAFSIAGALGRVQAACLHAIVHGDARAAHDAASRWGKYRLLIGIRPLREAWLAAEADPERRARIESAFHDITHMDAHWIRDTNFTE